MEDRLESESRTGRARSRCAAVAADHDVAGLPRADRTLPETGASRMPGAWRGRPARPRIVPGRTVLMSSPRHRPGCRPRHRRARRTARDRGVVGDHRDDDVGARGRLGRGRGDRRPDPLGQGARPAPASGCRARRSMPWSARRSAIAEPMRPVPRIATVGRPRRAPLTRVVQAALDRLDDAVDRRDREVLERRRRRQRDVRRRDPHDRRVQAVEALVGDDRGDLRAPAASRGFSSTVNSRLVFVDRGEDRRPCRAGRDSAGR